MSLRVTSVTTLRGLPENETNTGKQGWEMRQDCVLTVSFKHLNQILPEVSVTSGLFPFMRPQILFFA